MDHVTKFNLQVSSSYLFSLNYLFVYYIGVINDTSTVVLYVHVFFAHFLSHFLSGFLELKLYCLLCHRHLTAAEIHYLCGGLCTLQMSGKLPYTFKIRGITISWPVLHVMDGDTLLLLRILQLLEVKQKFTPSHPARVGGRRHRYVLKLNHFHVSLCRCPSHCQNITKY